MKGIGHVLVNSTFVILLSWCTWGGSNKQSGSPLFHTPAHISRGHAIHCGRRITRFPVFNTILSPKASSCALTFSSIHTRSRKIPLSAILRGGSESENEEESVQVPQDNATVKEETIITSELAHGSGLTAERGEEGGPTPPNDVQNHSPNTDEHSGSEQHVVDPPKSSSSSSSVTKPSQKKRRATRPVDDHHDSSSASHEGDHTVKKSAHVQAEGNPHAGRTKQPPSRTEVWEVSPGVNITDKHELGRLLIRACATGRVNDARELIECGADVEYRIVPADDEEEESQIVTWTPLMHAAAGGRTATCSMVLRHGANMSARDEFGATALHAAADRGRSATCLALIDMGADVKALTDPGKFTPLHYAAMRGYRHTVETLVRYGAEVRACVLVCLCACVLVYSRVILFLCVLCVSCVSKCNMRALFVCVYVS
jgi:ankyrin repeat protein